MNTMKTNSTTEAIEMPNPPITADTVDVPTVTVTATMPVTGPALAAQFATTPKRQKARKMPKEPSLLYAYAVEQGGSITLTDAVKQELVSRGLPVHRIPNAAYGIRKFFGKTVTPTRTGRTVTAYTISL